MKKLLILFAAILTFAVTSCSSGSEDDTMNPVPKTITYTNTIKTIIDNHCLGCHIDPPVSGALMSLITFQEVREAVTNRGLIDRVESGSMPQGANKLTASQIQAIKDWQAGGFMQ